eukprot:TRINITY_DN1900_c0_g1_i1.p1 TRINITY_DN1900_c0_g1~~TRINITY_DN1900_c0_g1_i1.p1  ORF type:complete len:435 (-),score=73.21 TRINITY_DN1900_c0_g1_i1:80-1384(-)
MGRLKEAWNVKKNFKSLFVKSKFPLLDGFRAWAVIYVVMYHYLNYWNLINPNQDERSQDLWNRFTVSVLSYPLGHGDLGVDIFFVLSGFLIFHMLASEIKKNNEINYMKFLYRRWLRLFPAYFFASFLWMFIPPLRFATTPDQLTTCKDYWWANFLFVNNFFAGQCVPVSWSIAIEFQFYLVSPLIVIGMLNKNKWAIGLPAFLSFLSVMITIALFVTNQDLYWQDTGGGLIYNKMYTRCAPYLFGMFISYIFDQFQSNLSQNQSPTYIQVESQQEIERDYSIILHDFFSSHKKLRWFSHFVFASFWIVFTMVGSRGRVDYSLAQNVFLIGFGRIFYGSAIAYFIYMGLTGHARGLTKVLCWRVWAPIARLSYSLYLTQFVGLLAGLFITYNGDMIVFTIFLLFFVLCAMGIIITLILDIFIYLLVEKPLMDMR